MLINKIAEHYNFNDLLTKFFMFFNNKKKIIFYVEKILKNFIEIFVLN